MRRLLCRVIGHNTIFAWEAHDIVVSYCVRCSMAFHDGAE